MRLIVHEYKVTEVAGNSTVSAFSIPSKAYFADVDVRSGWIERMIGRGVSYSGKLVSADGISWYTDGGRSLGAGLDLLLIDYRKAEQAMEKLEKAGIIGPR